MERVLLSLGELVDDWTVLEDERDLIAGKRGATRPDFALLLKFYTRHGRIGLTHTPDVEIATVILIRDREYVCDDRVADRMRQDAPAPRAEPVSLADEMRAIGWM